MFFSGVFLFVYFWQKYFLNYIYILSLGFLFGSDFYLRFDFYLVNWLVLSVLIIVLIQWFLFLFFNVDIQIVIFIKDFCLFILFFIVDLGQVNFVQILFIFQVDGYLWKEL